MKILTLRIYNSTPYYDEMYTLHRMYDKNSVYLMCSPTISEPTYDEKTCILTVPGQESFIPGILDKTLKGIEYCLKHFNFDILIRSNMSTIIDYVELTKQLSRIQRPYGGNIWPYNFQGKRFNYISGCCTVMNKDICMFLLNNKKDLIWSISDDVAIGMALFNTFPITFSTRFQQTNTVIRSTCFYRFRKNKTRYDDRSVDIVNMKNFYSNTSRGTICIASSS